MSKTILVATADDNEPEDSLVEEHDDEQEELDTRDYGEYTQEPIQLRRSKPKAADVAPNTDTHPPKTSKLPKCPQARRTDKLARPRLTVRQRVGTWIRQEVDLAFLRRLDADPDILDYCVYTLPNVEYEEMPVEGVHDVA